MNFNNPTSTSQTSNLTKTPCHTIMASPTMTSMAVLGTLTLHYNSNLGTDLWLCSTKQLFSTGISPLAFSTGNSPFDCSFTTWHFHSHSPQQFHVYTSIPVLLAHCYSCSTQPCYCGRFVTPLFLITPLLPRYPSLTIRLPFLPPPIRPGISSPAELANHAGLIFKELTLAENSNSK